MVFSARTLSGLLLLIALTACKDENNRVISEQVSPAGHAFHLMPITERSVTDITVSAAWATDWLNDPSNNPAVPHLATQMMLSGGTADLSPADVLDLLEDKNAHGDIAAAADLIYAKVEFPNNHQDAVLPVLAELFQRPAFDQAWFDRIKGQRREAAQAKDLPLVYDMWEAARHAMLGTRPQAEFMNAKDIGFLEAATLDDLRTWHQQSFDRAPVVLVVTGAVSAEGAGEIVDALLPPTLEQPDSFFEAKPLCLPEQMIYLHEPDSEKSVIGFLGTLPDTRDPKESIDTVALHVFANGADSPLFNAVRAELGATYSMSFDLVNYSRKQRSFVIGGEIETEKMPLVRDAVLTAYDAFRIDPALDRLPDVSKRIAESIQEHMTYVSDSAFMIRELILAGKDPQEYHSLPDDLRAFTDEDMRLRLRSVFPEAADLAVFAAGPDPSAFPEACVITTAAQATDCK